jgi:alkanesulfonate monooxygenase SsuD/methylene tetrahydromethanopterin reductase-like flavin-dependent oxidoreductase (luciferase family)
LNAAMLGGAAACCDGLAIHPLATGPLYVERTVAPIVAQARRDRPGGLSCDLWVITQIDEDPEAARGRARKALAFFFSTPGYETAAAGEPWADAPERIRRRFAETRADWEAVSAEVPDEMIDAMTLCGTPEQVRDQLPVLEARLGEAGIDEIVFQTGVDLGEAEFVANCAQIIACCGP